MARFDPSKLDLLPRSRRSLPTGAEGALEFAAGLAVAGGFWLGRRLSRAAPTGRGHPHRAGRQGHDAGESGRLSRHPASMNERVSVMVVPR